jgi:polysaccharide biosynthesis transport protein
MRQPDIQTVQDIDRISDLIPSPADTFKSTSDFVRRQYPIIGFVLAIAIALGFVYVMTTPPSFTATTTMMIDAKRVQLFQQPSMINDLPIDAATVESQIEVLKSETVAQAVIDKLHLVNDPEFVGPGGGLIGTVLNLVTSLFSFGETANIDSDFASKRTAVGNFESKLNIRRVGLTYVINISFQSLNPGRAAEVANAVANAYIDDQLEAKFDSARRAGSWLQGRLRELRDQASTAERAVVAFKNKNEMVDTGGRTINEQQLAELNSELVLARSKTAEAKARMDRVEAVLRNESPDTTVIATVADTLKNEVITKLRSKYLELAQREADWTPRYGATHLAVVNVRNQMHEIQNSIRDELQRIAQTYKSDLEIAKQNEESVQKQLEQAVAQSQVNNEAQVSLRELESNAQTYRALYDNFLQRYMESVQQQSFPITEARIITAATRPLGKSKPKTALVLGLAALVGLGLGFAGAAWRDFADRVFRTVSQVENMLHTECIALLPVIGKAARAKPVRPVKVVETGQYPSIVTKGIYSTVVDAPLSAYAEAIRAIKVAIDLSPSVASGRIIGITSSIPDEGKSTTAVSIARLIAMTGARTLLVDADLRNPTLSRSLTPKAHGLQEVLKGQSDLESAIWFDRATGLYFLPASVKGGMAQSSEILASPATRKFFDTLRQSYNYIIVDFSPLMPIVDVRVSANLVDSYIYVIKWGDTRIDYVKQALRSARGVTDNLLGVVLNQVDLTALGRYDGGSGSYYRSAYYQRYGYGDGD